MSDVRSDVPMNKSAHICATINALLEVMPEQGPLKRLHDKVFYTAPELLDNVWLQVYNLLITQPAVTEARVIWNAACKANISSNCMHTT
jgi:hypothetical protein